MPKNWWDMYAQVQPWNIKGPRVQSRRGARLNHEGDGLESAGNRVNPNYTLRAAGARPGGGLNGNGYRPQSDDPYLLARAIYAESGVTPGDMPAIGWSIINRIGFTHGRSRRPVFGATLAEVLDQRAGNGLYQYSIRNDGGSPAWRESASPSTIPATGRRTWAQAMAVANGILSGRVPDPSGGAQYFFASSTYDPRRIKTAPSDFQQHIAQRQYEPTPYQSSSTQTEDGRPRRNYLFRETPVKEWLPDEWFPEFHRNRHRR